jgi:AraC-like DNA-binding protein
VAGAETIAAAMVLRLVRLLQAREVAVKPLLAEAGLSLAALQPSAARVAYAAADQLLEAAAQRLGANGLGLELAQTQSDESYGAAGLLLVTGSTFRQGLSRSLGYQRLWGDGERFTLLPVESDCAVRFRHPGPSRLAGAIAAECALVEVLEGLRALVEPDAVPVSVDFAHAALGDAETLADHFGVVPRFEQAENRIVLPARLVDQPMHAFRDLLGAALERQAARALALLPAKDSMVARVQPLLAEEQGLSRSLTDVAEALRVSPRTLQRRLRQEQSSFEQLVDEVRQAQALQLERLGTPAKEIAFRLGFQDPSALSRARRRWRK